MKKYRVYLKYVLRHKWFVFWDCLRLDVPFWIAVFHDWDKFLPSMMLAYANFFYDESGNNIQRRSKFGYYRPADTGDARFERAILSHIRRNKHHWQYWVTPEHSYEIPEVYVREMIADWCGASKAQGVTGSIYQWYNENREKMVFHENTRTLVEKLIMVYG